MQVHLTWSEEYVSVFLLLLAFPLLPHCDEVCTERSVVIRSLHKVHETSLLWPHISPSVVLTGFQ